MVEGGKSGRRDVRPQKDKPVETISQASFKAAGSALHPGQGCTDTGCMLSGPTQLWSHPLSQIWGQTAWPMWQGRPAYLPVPIHHLSLAGDSHCLAPRGFRITIPLFILVFHYCFLNAYHVPGPGLGLELQLGIRWLAGHGPCVHEANRPCGEKQADTE